ncbi:DinB superfamily protein [Rubripirellula tenax]|uniref:DinB superfamily protein n=1 Tax=Rubripirellula tenax TaxID=2528015 RepID=A0A5C6F368_9BACT|nr:DinB family protein [Rubripirellula tenax]TWU54867.1 DinB superfamily protein [Rubripirellula tenax]
MITLTGYIIVSEEEIAQIREALPKHIDATRAESGCLRFDVNESEHERGRFDVYEQFRDRESFEQHQARAKASEWANISRNVERHYTVSGMPNISDATASALLNSVAAARDWLLDLDDQTVRHRPSLDRWSIIEVLGHLVDSACNNHQRFVRGQESDELVFPKYEQNSWVSKGYYQQSDWVDLVELWSHYNRHLAQVIKHIPESQLATPCTITPYETCSLEFIVTDYVTHLNHHLNRIRERVA